MPDQSTGQDRPEMRAGMPLAERQQLRDWILDRALKEARRQASEVYVSTRCRSHLPQYAGAMSEAQRRDAHVACLGESAGSGCLCPWHDEDQGPQPEPGEPS